MILNPHLSTPGRYETCLTSRLKISAFSALSAVRRTGRWI
jgi:hypothetical protein